MTAVWWAECTSKGWPICKINFSYNRHKSTSVTYHLKSRLGPTCRVMWRWSAERACKGSWMGAFMLFSTCAHVHGWLVIVVRRVIGRVPMEACLKRYHLNSGCWVQVVIEKVFEVSLLGWLLSQATKFVLFAWNKLFGGQYSILWTYKLMYFLLYLVFYSHRESVFTAYWVR